MVSLFWYLVLTLSSTNKDWPVVERNLRRDLVKWGQLVKILGRGGADKRTVGRFYVVAVQAMILFLFETWVMTPRLEKSLEGFHQWAVRRMAGMGTKHQQDGI